MNEFSESRPRTNIAYYGVPMINAKRGFSRRASFEQLEDRTVLATGVFTGSNLANVAIPDMGGFDQKGLSAVIVAGLPTDAMVTDVEVEYWIEHAWVSDLRVYATTQRNGVWRDHLYLWNREHSGNDEIHEIESGLDAWDGLNPNGAWYLVAGDFAASNVGAISGWRISIDWVAPDPLPAIAKGRIAWHSYTDYSALDGLIHVYDFEDGAFYERATATIAAVVTHAHNPNFSADGRYMVFMGLPAGSTDTANWRHYLDVFLYDFVTDEVTNVSARLGLDQPGSIEEDPALAPAGDRIAFKRNVSNIWETDVFGTSLRQLTAGAGEKSGPQYSPDGASLVFWVGTGATAALGGVSLQHSLPTTPTLLHDNLLLQDYFPSYWDDERIVYATWRSQSAHDDDVNIWNIQTRADGAALFNSLAEDSDPFGLTPTLLGFSTNRSLPYWRLWYGDPATGAAADLGISRAGRHNLGAKYAKTKVVYEAPSANFNGDAAVDGQDFLQWQRGYGIVAPFAAKGDGDANNDRAVDFRDLAVWQMQYRSGDPLNSEVRSTDESLLEPIVAEDAEFKSNDFLIGVAGTSWTRDLPTSTARSNEAHDAIVHKVRRAIKMKQIRLVEYNAAAAAFSALGSTGLVEADNQMTDSVNAQFLESWCHDVYPWPEVRLGCQCISDALRLMAIEV
ncbi:TolB family protein [Lacipirellula limnantheis]|nr:hypothetical protein [Lacipirellula limnantheis]